MQKTDQQIWEGVEAGDVSSLKLLHDRYFFSLCNFANKSLHQLAISEELVSNCFVRLWEQRKTIAVKHSLKSYLYFMVRNQVVDYIRIHKKDLLLLTEEVPDVPSDEEINEQEFYAELYRAIGKLPEQRRKILELAAFESLSYKEIAVNLNISINTVKTQMGRAYQFLKEELDPRHFSVFLSVHFSS